MRVYQKETVLNYRIPHVQRKKKALCYSIHQSCNWKMFVQDCREEIMSRINPTYMHIQIYPQALTEGGKFMINLQGFN